MEDKCKTFLSFLAIPLFLLLISTEGSAQTTPFVEPDDGRAPLTGALDQVNESVDIYIFNLTLPSDDEILDSIRAAVGRGVTVRALLEPCPQEGGAVCVPPNAEARAACELLTQSGVAVKWANPAFPKTHAKAALLDNNKAIIITLNLVPQTFSVRRDYGVVTDDPGVIENLSRVFTQDWQDDPAVTDCSQTPDRLPDPASQDYSTLIISPDINPVTGVSRAREQLVGTAETPGLIRSAQSSLRVQMEKIDPGNNPQNPRHILPALIDRIEQGVPVQVLLKPPTPSELDNRTVARRINMAGGEARCQPSLHAKMMIVDAQQVYVGSHNLTRNSLDERREIGWVTSDSATLTRFQQTFDADWALAGSCELP